MSRHRVMVTVPGPSVKSDTVISACHASQQQDCELVMVNRGPDNFNECWCDLLNAAERGSCDFGAILHADIVPEDWWLDKMLDAMWAHDAQVMSVIVPKKGTTGCLSCGVGDPARDMEVHRHFTMREAFNLPETFGAADCGYEGWPLLFNTGCVLIDLRDGRFAKTNPDGSLFCWFDFPKEYGRRHDGTFGLRGARSEDYWFAARAHDLEARCFCTRTVRLYHEWPWCNNTQPWGEWMNGDELNAHKWRKAVVHGKETAQAI